jgi:hypothetical protein
MPAEAAVAKQELMAPLASTLPAASEIPADDPPPPAPELCRLAGGSNNQ